MLSIENISKKFGPQVLFQGASFSLGNRERIGLLGPNGAGKSTFFKILMGIEDMDGGQIHTPSSYRMLLMEQEWHPQPNDTVVEASLKVFEDWHNAKTKLEKIAKDLEKDANLLVEYQAAENQFLSLGGYQIPSEIKEILSGLGFTEDHFDQEAVTLSGGWRMRCYLAGLLIQKADLLLLDEPTNHLDMDSVVWFENFLMSYPHSVMIISHDRRLIETISDKILEFSPPKLTLWPYGLKKFEASKEERMEQIQKEVLHKQREIDKHKNFARRFGANATKARQAQNKLKTAEYFEEEMEKLQEAMPIEAKRKSKFRLELTKRQPKVCMKIEKASFGYDEGASLFSIDHVWIESGKKIGVIGDNGVGKTTLLKSLAGELDPLDGKVDVHQGSTISLFTQHRMEELPLNGVAIDYLIEKSNNQSISFVRSVAAGLGLSDVDMEKNISVMSGGEKARLSLSNILLQKPDILLLDEPTNHLDLEACDSLIAGLKEYEGTVIVVSHNRDFLDSMVNQIVHLKNGTAQMHLGNYSDFAQRTQTTTMFEVAKPQKDQDNKSKKSKEEKRQQAQARQEKSKVKSDLLAQVKELDENMDAYKEEMREIDAFLIKPDKKGSMLFADKLKRRGRLQDKLELSEQKWFELQEELESID
ncbi:MAG: ABC-F family ATP-binding cassette domain-containing protein [Bdellovibrionales bacterium]|nr:ABC-F family ATP-binding cassette domain-containing protein [Bdellovibrionales bacterium]